MSLDYLLKLNEFFNLLILMCCRWNERFPFWHVNTTDKQQNNNIMPERPLSVGHWRLLIYVKTSSTDSIDDSIARNLNGQTRMRCEHHQNFLVKQPTSSNLECCVKDCNRNARWRCSGRSMPCWSAVCYAHGKDFVNGDNVVEISFEMVGRRLPNRTSAAVNVSNSVPQVESSELDDEESNESVCAPIGIDDFAGYDDQAPIHTRQDVVPIYNCRDTDTVASH